jgi:hypothetical protein
MKIAVFYHARLSGGRNYLNYADNKSVAIGNGDFAKNMLIEQLSLLMSSGLYAASNKIVLCINGAESDAEFLRQIAPEGCEVVWHGEGAESLIPTFLLIEQWVRDHPGWFVCFWHMKGVIHQREPFYRIWRQCMERCVIRDWDKCVADLAAGYDTVGAHWLTREKYGPMVNPEHGGTPFWGGVFFWATSEYLSRLTPMPKQATCTADWYWPEHWIGTGGNIKAKDYADHWPGAVPCQQNNP